jgi:hypothetical protein
MNNKLRRKNTISLSRAVSRLKTEEFVWCDYFNYRLKITKDDGDKAWGRGCKHYIVQRGKELYVTQVHLSWPEKPLQDIASRFTLYPKEFKALVLEVHERPSN